MKILPTVKVWLDRIVGAVLVLAGTGKLFQSHHFMLTLHESGSIPPSIVPVLAGTLPSIEIVTGTALILARFSLGARLVAAVLFLSFAVFHFIAALRGLRVNCGCFGTFISDIEGGWWVAVATLAISSMLFASLGCAIRIKPSRIVSPAGPS